MDKPKIIISEPYIYIPGGSLVSHKITTAKRKRIGEILLEADLVSQAQLDLALQDQKRHQQLTLGEILALRGWIKQETADFFAEKWFERLARESKKPIGQYLQEAALLTDAQIKAILQEQQQNWLKFGTIAVLKGWLKQTTVNYFIQSIAPEKLLASPYVQQSELEIPKQKNNDEVKTQKLTTKKYIETSGDNQEISKEESTEKAELDALLAELATEEDNLQV